MRHKICFRACFSKTTTFFSEVGVAFLQIFSNFALPIEVNIMNEACAKMWQKLKFGVNIGNKLQTKLHNEKNIGKINKTKRQTV